MCMTCVILDILGSDVRRREPLQCLQTQIGFAQESLIHNSPESADTTHPSQSLISGWAHVVRMVSCELHYYGMNKFGYGTLLQICDMVSVSLVNYFLSIT